MTTLSRYLPVLSRDFAKLLETGKSPDLLVRVGKGTLTRNFSAHSLIIHTRSPFFAKLLDDKKTFGVLKDAESSLPVLGNMVLENMNPAIFELLLRYIYGGNLPLENRGGRHVMELLTASDNLLLNDVLEEIQEYFIHNNIDYFLEHFGTVSQTVISHPSLSILKKACDDIIRTRPEAVFNCKDFLSIPEETLVELLKNDDVAMEEVEIWQRVIQWGITKTPNLVPNPAGWTLLEFGQLQNTLKKCIPYIRFHQLTSAEFQDHVWPYLSILGNQLATDILSFYFKPGYRVPTKYPPPRYGAKSQMIAKMVPTVPLDSTIINERHASLISIWIRRMENEDPLGFKHVSIKNHFGFKLLLRASRDGFTSKDFHRLCDEKGPTLTVVKVKGTGELLGGYNPLDWKSAPDGKYQSTCDSFIFSFGDRFPRTAVLSRVSDPKQAIFSHKNWGASFGVFDFGLHGNFEEEGMCRCKKGQYELDIRPPESNDYAVEEYEVFQVIDHSLTHKKSNFWRNLILLSFAIGIAAIMISFSFCLYSLCSCEIQNTLEIFYMRAVRII